MIQAEVQSERHAIPRWSRIRTSISLGEMDSYKKREPPKRYPSASDNLQKLLDEWHRNKNLPLAVEIISESRLTCSTVDIGEVAEYVKTLVRQNEKIPFLIRQFIGEEFEQNSEMQLTFQDSIAQIRQSLNQFSSNPLLWVELARNYLILGLAEKSERALLTAITLAPNNRTVLRAIVRFFIHVGELDKAKFYLNKSPLVTRDPWILASEIALSNNMGKTSKNIKLGRDLLLCEDIAPIALSELASELSTMDFIAGNNKQGKKKLSIVRNSMHENAFAQLIWINNNVYNINSIITDSISPKCNYEAQARAYYSDGDWKNALESSGNWLEYQPFSRDPALLSSYIAADFLGDLDKAKDAIMCGIKSNPNDISIVNNDIYISILRGDYKNAEIKLKKAEQQFDIGSSIILTATKGLYFYRTGNPCAGHAQYKDAIKLAEELKNEHMSCKAAIYLAREEKRVGNNINSLLNYIDKHIKAPHRNECNALIQSFNLKQ